MHVCICQPGVLPSKLADKAAGTPWPDLKPDLSWFRPRLNADLLICWQVATPDLQWPSESEMVLVGEVLEEQETQQLFGRGSDEKNALLCHEFGSAVELVKSRKQTA